MLLDLSEIVIRENMHVELDLDELRRKGEEVRIEDPDFQFVEPVRGHLTFENGGDLINIRGKVEASLKTSCARCLTDVTMSVPVQVEEHFPIADVLNPTRQPEVDEDYDSTINTTVYLDQGRPILDLDELIRELILTEVPMASLCSDACQGLCPDCGANRNENPCTCELDRANKPLAGLASLLQEDGH